MTYYSKRTCDKCGVVVVETGVVSGPVVQVQMNDETPLPDGGTQLDGWVSWDLCLPCGKDIRDLLAAFAKPSET